jgi:hypothetical protein
MAMLENAGTIRGVGQKGESGTTFVHDCKTCHNFWVIRVWKVGGCDLMHDCLFLIHNKTREEK